MVYSRHQTPKASSPTPTYGETALAGSPSGERSRKAVFRTTSVTRLRSNDRPIEYAEPSGVYADFQYVAEPNQPTVLGSAGSLIPNTVRCSSMLSIARPQDFGIVNPDRPSIIGAWFLHPNPRRPNGLGTESGKAKLRGRPPNVHTRARSLLGPLPCHRRRGAFVLHVTPERRDAGSGKDIRIPLLRERWARWRSTMLGTYLPAHLPLREATVSTHFFQGKPRQRSTSPSAGETHPDMTNGSEPLLGRGMTPNMFKSQCAL